MKDIVQLLDDPGVTIAVVGATDDSAKYGSVIYRDLKSKGYAVYPVNKRRKTVDGDPAFSSVADLPFTPSIINIVVPPEETTIVLRQCLKLGLKNVWVQPGAESPQVLTILQENGFNYLASACIMVESRLQA